MGLDPGHVRRLERLGGGERPERVAHGWQVGVLSPFLSGLGVARGGIRSAPHHIDGIGEAGQDVSPSADHGVPEVGPKTMVLCRLLDGGHLRDCSLGHGGVQGVLGQPASGLGGLVHENRWADGLGRSLPLDLGEIPLDDGRWESGELGEVESLGRLSRRRGGALADGFRQGALLLLGNVSDGGIEIKGHCCPLREAP